MPTSDPIEVLLAHDHWASRNLLSACGPLTDGQFHRRFEMGPGSLHDTTTHVIGAMRRWTDFMARREARPRLEEDGSRRTPGQLLALLDEAAADLKTQARAGPPDELISGERGGRMYTFSRGGVLAHVATHAMHHRAQCLNMLRQLGVTPLPPSSVLEWMLTADPAR